MRFVDELERRTGSRRCEPLACNLLIDGRKRAGRLRDLSAGGLYVETEDALPSGASVVVSFLASDGRRFVLEALSPRRVPMASHSLAGLASPGCALRIPNPPETYLRWLEASHAAS